jgi:hypothetical protein
MRPPTDRKRNPSLPPGEIPEGCGERDLGIPPHRISEISPVRGYQEQEIKNGDWLEF